MAPSDRLGDSVLLFHLVEGEGGGLTFRGDPVSPDYHGRKHIDGGC